MARGVNKVILLGRLGQDPELRYTGNGTAVCNMSIATDSSYRNDDGDLVEQTEWHRVVAWSRLAEICSEYLEKGRQVYLEGRLQTRQWEDKEGNTRYTTEIVAQDIQFLGSREQQPVGSGDGPQFDAPAGDSPAPSSSSGDDADDDFEFEPDDELPF